MPLEENLLLRIERMNARGWGRSTLLPPSKAVVDVIGALPDEEVRVCLFKKRRSKCQARLIEVIQPSPLRVAARCSHVPTCGGCTWQHLDYTEQLRLKETHFKELFGALLEPHVELRPILSMANPWQYRNKMEFSFSQNKAGESFLGLILAGSKGHVFNLQECHLVAPWFAHVVQVVRTWWQASGLGAYRFNDTGALRTLTLREGKRTGDKLVMLTVSGNPAYAMTAPQLKSFVEAVQNIIPVENRTQLSIFLRVQQICKGSPTQFYELLLAGPAHIREKMHIDGRDLTFKISPSSFFQPNTEQAERLYNAAAEMIPEPLEHILDLYAGTATFAIAFARKAKRVTAIELNPYAVYDGESNAELNGIANLTLHCGDVGKKLEELRLEGTFQAPDLVIVDPPRTGLDARAIAHLRALSPKKILYVSCHPATQVENIHQLIAEGAYRLTVLQPVDQFPHTLHLENIAVLERKK